MSNTSMRATLSNLDLLLKRGAQRKKDSEEDRVLESKVSVEIASHIKSRKDSTPRLEALVHASLDAAYPPTIQRLIDEWMDTLDFCETAASFHSKTYGRGNETFIELSERARTMRECISQLCQSTLNNE